MFRSILSPLSPPRLPVHRVADSHQFAPVRTSSYRPHRPHRSHRSHRSHRPHCSVSSVSSVSSLPSALSGFRNVFPQYLPLSPLPEASMFLFSLLFAPAYLSAWHHPDCRSKNTRRPALFPPATSPRAVLAFAGTPCFCRYFPLFLSGGSCFSCRPCFSVTLPFPGCFSPSLPDAPAGCPCSCRVPLSALLFFAVLPLGIFRFAPAFLPK